ncbi:MAG: hypothetical protein ACTSWW_02215 [Promethearchaeota archaeon]
MDRMVLDQILLNLGIISKIGNRIIGAILGVLSIFLTWQYITETTTNHLIYLLVSVGMAVLFLFQIPAKIGQGYYALGSDQYTPEQVPSTHLPQNQF